MKKIVILTGAGISAESGIKTFRDSDGLWETHRVEDVATFSAWQRNPQLVLEFYNQRRKQLYEVHPNAAHHALVKLEQKYDVQIVTQNIDDLHERAGSSKVLHLHGELKKVRSTADPNIVYELDGWELKMGDFCEKGSQLRPHVVWFGESVPLIVDAEEMVSEAEICLVVGTSMKVYPAAGLVQYVRKSAPIYYVDPQADTNRTSLRMIVIAEKAGKAIPELVEKLLQEG